ncbi:acylphosphatase [soil metagenome]|jgi:acylphosphatase|nr:acylphosphatase [Actinomycetota bacterium]MDQ3218390.1 acylphosphatase [Actinomycetota bacterium]
MTIRRRLLVSGRVQGVFYRDSCRREAEEKGIAGSARNLSDGRVEVILEGDEDAINRMIDWCRRGSSQARVDSVEVEDQDPQGATGFRA